MQMVITLGTLLIGLPQQLLVSLTEGNTTSLPLAELNAFAQEDHERYDLIGLMKTQILRLVPYLVQWLPTKEMLCRKPESLLIPMTTYFGSITLKPRVDGSYELSNLPSGNWIVFAEPPFESEEYLGLSFILGQIGISHCRRCKLDNRISN